MTDLWLAARLQQWELLLSQQVWDEEALHRFRVLIRSLDGQLPLWCARPVRQRLRARWRPLFKQSGRGRDADVFIPLLTGLPDQEIWVAKLEKRKLKRARRPEQRDLQRLQRRIRRFLAIDPQQRRSTYRLANKTIQRVLRRLNACHPHRPESLHALRLAIKRQRYLLEWMICQPRPTGLMLDSALEQALTLTKQWQTRLGGFSDRCALADWLGKKGGDRTLAVLKPRLVQEAQLLCSELPDLASALLAWLALPPGPEDEDAHEST